MAPPVGKLTPIDDDEDSPVGTLTPIQEAEKPVGKLTPIETVPERWDPNAATAAAPEGPSTLEKVKNFFLGDVKTNEEADKIIAQKEAQDKAQGNWGVSTFLDSLHSPETIIAEDKENQAKAIGQDIYNRDYGYQGVVPQTSVEREAYDKAMTGIS